MQNNQVLDQNSSSNRQQQVHFQLTDNNILINQPQMHNNMIIDQSDNDQLMNIEGLQQNVIASKQGIS